MIEQIRRAEGEAGEDLVEIWPEHRDIVEGYLAVSTQWRTEAPFGAGVRYLGLDYNAVKARLDGGPIALTPEFWDGLSIMELEVRAIFNARD